MSYINTIESKYIEGRGGASAESEDRISLCLESMCDYYWRDVIIDAHHALKNSQHDSFASSWV